MVGDTTGMATLGTTRMPCALPQGIRRPYTQGIQGFRCPTAAPPCSSPRLATPLTPASPLLQPNQAQQLSLHLQVNSLVSTIASSAQPVV